MSERRISIPEGFGFLYRSRTGDEAHHVPPASERRVPAELPRAAGPSDPLMRALEIPKDVQQSIEDLYGEAELLRRIAEVDQRDARFRDELVTDITQLEEQRRREA